MSEHTTDILIIGAGPAGLAAALYAGRSLVKPVVLERLSVGGLVLSTEWIDNYPGFPDGIAAPELMERMHRQAERFGAEFVSDEALSLTRQTMGSAYQLPGHNVQGWFRHRSNRGHAEGPSCERGVQVSWARHQLLCYL